MPYIPHTHTISHTAFFYLPTYLFLHLTAVLPAHTQDFVPCTLGVRFTTTVSGLWADLPLPPPVHFTHLFLQAVHSCFCRTRQGWTFCCCILCIFEYIAFLCLVFTLFCFCIFVLHFCLPFCCTIFTHLFVCIVHLHLFTLPFLFLFLEGCFTIGRHFCTAT